MRGRCECRQIVRDAKVIGFVDDKRGPRAEEHGWPLEARNSKETDCPLEILERNAARPTILPVRPMSDF